MEYDQIMTGSSDCLSLSNLPSNVISKIVQNLPVSYRKNFALTCKKFYKIVCQEDRFKYRMEIDSEKKLFDVYDSVMASERVFDEVDLSIELSEETLVLLTRIAERHGSTVKKLFLFIHQPNKLKASQFQVFLEQFKNLNDFVYDGPIDFCDEPEAVLQNLKAIEALEWDDTILKFIQPNTIECFGFGANQSQVYQKFLECQRNLKRISFTDSVSSTDFKNLKLESIRYWGENRSKCNQLIRDHANTLTEISLDTIESRTLDIICIQSENLESLRLVVTKENVTSLLQISRLKKLNQLGLLCRVSSLKDVAKLKMMSIKKLDLGSITSNGQFPEEILDDIGKNWSNIEELNVNDLILPMNKVFLRFKKLKILNFSSDKLLYNYDGHVHSGVEKLQCFSQKSFNFPPYAMHALPNLKSLEVTSCDFLGALQLRALNDMKRLKELKIEFYIESDDLILNAEDIKELKKLMNSLEDCEIRFWAPNNFIDELAEGLKGEVYRVFKSGDYKSLYIKIKY